MVIELPECKDWELRERLLNKLRRKSRKELLEALKVITEHLEGEEVFRELLATLA